MEKSRIIKESEIQAVLDLLSVVTAFSHTNLGDYVKLIDGLRALPKLESKTEEEDSKPHAGELVAPTIEA